MKKWLLCTAFLLISMLAGTSCVMDNDDLPDCPPPTPPTKEAPVVTAYLYCNDKRIAWEEGNRIGVYMIDNEKETLLQDSLGAPYLLNDIETGLFIPQWGISDQVISRPPLGVLYDAIGVFPYGNSLKDTECISVCVSDQNKPEKLDIFTPHRISGITAETDTLHFDFHRRMSRLLFNLTLKEVKADQSEAEANGKLAGASILVNGLPVDGTFMLDNDKLETGDAQPFQAYLTEDGKQGQAIVFPNESTKDVRFQVSLPQCPDTLYSFVLDEKMALESCHSYTLDLDMKYVCKPEVKQYDIKYRYEGIANKDNVSVTRGESQIGWGEGDVIRLDENSDFTFQYQSGLKVSVRTEEGETLPMTSGQPYTFHKINKDIIVIIRADEEEKPEPEPDKTYKVTYKYEGEANANNVKVFKNGTGTAWPQSETITVKEDTDFSFAYNSDMVVRVRTKEGETLSMSSGKAYTFTHINKDIEIIIYAETPEYAVKYVFQGEYTEENVEMQKKVQSAFEAWAKTQTIWVTEGNDFSFKANSEFTVSVKVRDKELTKNADGSYTLKNIYENITVVISTNIHKVIYKYVGEANKDNVSVYKNKDLNQSWIEETEIILVDDGKDFTFGTDSRYELVTGSNETSLTATPVQGSATKNTFIIEKVTEDKVVTIAAKTKEDLLEHKVEYVFIGNADSDNTDVKTSGKAWNEKDAGTQIVKDGESFSFNATSQYTLTMTAKYPNDRNAEVKVEKNGTTYSISNIKKNVIVFIRVTFHKVSFTYTGNYVNTTNVPVEKISGTTSTQWEPTDKGIVKVDDKGDFTFTNKSEYLITVTGYGNPFTVEAGKQKTLATITQDIELVITANIYKVTYVFDNPPSDNVETWVDVKQSSKPWNKETIFYIEKDKDFVFDCGIKSGTNGRIVHVKESNTDVPVSSTKYTLSKIQSDKEIHIKAVKTYTVYYKFADGTTPPNGFTIWGKGNTRVDNWSAGDTHKIIADAGSDFVFELNKDLGVAANCDYAKGLTDYQYIIKNVQKDITIILEADKPYVSFTMPNEISCDKYSDYVTMDSQFTFKPNYPTNKPESRYEFIVQYKEHIATNYTTLHPTRDGNYTLPTNVNTDMDIVITIQRKPADVKISASVKEWNNLKRVPGGVIYPD